MLVACDVDGTIDANPEIMQFLASAIRKAGGKVAILTGLKGTSKITPADVAVKRAYLQELGFGAYDSLVVFPDNKDLPAAKARWCRDHGADLMIDNDRGNAQAAVSSCMVLVPWGTRVGKVKNGMQKALATPSGETVTVLA